MAITLSRPGRFACRRVFKTLDLRYTSNRRPPDAKLGAHWVATYAPAAGGAPAYDWWAPRVRR